MVDLFTWEISKRKKKMYTSTKRLIVFIPTLAAGTVSCSLIAGTFEESIPLTKCHRMGGFQETPDRNVLQGSIGHYSKGFEMFTYPKSTSPALN